MTSETPACIHRILEGNIHEFVVTEASRRAVDEMFVILERLQIEAVQNNDLAAHTMPALADLTVGLLPLNYSFLKLQPLITRYPQMRRARVAMIISPNPLLKTVSMVMRSVTPMRFYTPTERDLALVWLREANPMPR